MLWVIGNAFYEEGWSSFQGVYEPHTSGLNEESDISRSYWLAGNWHWLELQGESDRNPTRWATCVHANEISTDLHRWLCPHGGNKQLVLYIYYESALHSFLYFINTF